VTSRLHALCIDAQEPPVLAAFWSGLLGWPTVTDRGVVALEPDDDTGFLLRFLPGGVRGQGTERVHLHLTSATDADQETTVARALALGARHLDVGQLPEEGHVVLADPEGNALCVIEAGNSFLADCGFLGELACDGTREVGLFWSAALDWPLVWDQDQETAIRSPHGGPKIAWGGPPVAPKTARNPMHLDLVVPPGEDLAAEVNRLVALGAHRAEATDPRTSDVVAMTDPDGNEFCLAATR
jgi:hypothetical protein